MSVKLSKLPQGPRETWFWAIKRLAVLLLFSAMLFGIRKTSLYYKAKNKTDIANEVINKENIVDELSLANLTLTYPQGYVDSAATFKAETSTTLERNDTGAPIKNLRFFEKKWVFYEGADTLNGQIYCIVSLGNSDGVKIPSLYFGVLYENVKIIKTPEEKKQFCRQLADEQVSTKVNSVKLISTAGPPNQITIDCSKLWTTTNRTIPDNCLLTIKVNGKFLNSYYGNWVTANGVCGGFDSGKGPIENSHPLACYAKIGEAGQPWLVGTNNSTRIIKGGMLYLGINDDGLWDNKGEWYAEITTSPCLN